MRVLVIEDNISLAGLITARLGLSGIDSDHVDSVVGAEKALSEVSYAAVVLDLGLQDGDGLDLLRKLRSAGDDIPVLIATARYSLADRVRGLQEGADDYLAKPFSVDELIARLQALLRRPGRLLGQTLAAGNIVLDTTHHQVNIGNRVLPMRLRETLILELMMRRLGEVVPRRTIEEVLFGLEIDRSTNTLDVYVHRLRRQLGEVGATVALHTIRGVGYMMTATVADRGEPTIERCDGP